METATTNTAIWNMLAERFRKTIRAKSLSELTERGYLYTARRWAAWLAAEGLDLEPAGVRAHHVDDFIADIIGATSAANGAHHYRNLRVYCVWLTKRGEMTANPMDQTEPPNVPDKIIPVLTDDEHHAVLAACAGSDFVDRRDTAIILLFIDTGLRVSEVAGLQHADVDLKTQQFTVRGKGSKIRIVGFGNSTGLALARYLKARAQRYPNCDVPDLWLSSRREMPLRADGIKCMLSRRGRQAGLSEPLFAHRFRHDFSDRWQAAGGSEHGLMQIAGWSSTKMPRHYGRQQAMRRALAEQRRLGLADRLT